MEKKKSMNNNNKNLNNEYIAGFVHGDGSFSVGLSVQKSKKSVKLSLRPTFTITQKKAHIDLMKEIWTRFNNVGFHSIDNKNIIRYRVISIKALTSVIIPFFTVHQLKYEKLLDFIKFKFIVSKLITIEKKWYSYELKNEFNDLILDLITISVNMNRNVKPSIELKYLSDIDKKRVLDNNLSIEISKELDDYILNFNKKNEVNIDFINGLFDSNGWITLSLTSSKTNLLKLVLNYGIISDLLNENIIYDIKSYFNNVGSILKRNNEKTIMYLVDKEDILREILPNIYNVSNYKDILKINDKGPIIKDIKIKKIIEIMNMHEELKFCNDIDKKELLNKILLMSYEIRDINLKNKESLKDYLIRIKNKLNINK